LRRSARSIRTGSVIGSPFIVSFAFVTMCSDPARKSCSASDGWSLSSSSSADEFAA
jgi:hypothetical protein